MRIFSKTTLRSYWYNHPDTEAALRLWYKKVVEANWTKAADVKETYGNASILANDVVVFNICGRLYRLIVRVKYRYHVVYVCWFGTHFEYDEIRAEEACDPK